VVVASPFKEKILYEERKKYSNQSSCPYYSNPHARKLLRNLTLTLPKVSHDSLGSIKYSQISESRTRTTIRSDIKILFKESFPLIFS
jgi:hypothetical protein